MYDNLNISSEKNNKIYITDNNICSNCGKTGHVYKKCFNPITSFGIICFKKDDLKSIEKNFSNEKWKQFSLKNEKKNIFSNKFKFLLIRRKDSLSFAELVRAKYDINDIDYIKSLLKNMSIDEQNFLKSVKTPDEIWNRLWTFKKKSKTHINEYNRVKKKLTILLNDLKDKDEKKINIKSLIKKVSSKRKSPEWGFPKGRRILKESNIQCAIREFCEETDINESDINLLKKFGPVEEIFIGSNNVVYKHIYYIAEIKKDIDLSINPCNMHQIAEIGDINWFTPTETIEKLEDKNTERIKIFKKIISFLDSIST
jgi:8-oxo-dGTP pyrophosphatase MutT (NUDIX family)